KHVPVNEALTRLDAIVQISVLSRALSEPPAEPESGDRYIVADEPTDAWLGQDGAIASYDAGWWFTVPGDGWLAWDRTAQELVVFTDGVWAAVPAGTMGGEAGLQNVPLLGVATMADEANPFSARLNSSLWTALELGEG